MVRQYTKTPQCVLRVVDTCENLLPKNSNFYLTVEQRLRGTGFENLLKLTRLSKHILLLIIKIIDQYDVFIFEHIPWVASRLLHPSIKKISSIIIVEDLQNHLNDFPLPVEWTPYARLLGNFLPSPYDGQVALERALASLISQEKGQKMQTMRDMGTLITTCSLWSSRIISWGMMTLRGSNNNRWIMMIHWDMMTPWSRIN
ncbi:hypothetical protein GOBAR_DD22987 [Gossypium barbadense]|nr:hypothetical protein GOBAR_DD22987 [Gossypium barbadense]